MAKDLEELVLSISADNRQILRALKRLEGATNETTRKVEQRFDAMAKNIDGKLVGIGKNAFRNLLASTTALIGVRELARLADTWTDLTSRVNIAVGSQEKGAEVMGRLGEMARRTYSALELTTESYISNSRALQELGYGTNQQLDYTEALNNGLVISAARGERAAAVQNALSKAMASGRLQGVNLNTVIEQGGRVAQALADGLGVGVNQLRSLGAQGKITSRDIYNALTSQMVTLRKEAESMPATISDGFQLLRNALLEYVGTGDQATGVSARISEALIIMADNFDKTADAGLQLAGVLAGALLGRSITQMVRQLGLGGAALISFTRALTAARGIAAATAAFGSLGAAAGPVGVLVGGAVAASLIVAANNAGEARDRVERLNEEFVRLGLKAPQAAEAIDETAEAVDRLADEKRAQILRDINDELDRLRGNRSLASAIFGRPEGEATEIGDLIRQLGNRMVFAGGDERTAASGIIEALTALRDTRATVAETRVELDRLGKLDISAPMRELHAQAIRTTEQFERGRKVQAARFDTTEIDGYRAALEDIRANMAVTAEQRLISAEQHQQLNRVVDELQETGEVSEESRQVLERLGRVGFAAGIIAQINGIIPKLQVLAEEARNAGSAITAAGLAETRAFREADAASMAAYRAQKEAADNYIAEALRRAQLGKDQLALENEIARVRNDALKEGVTLTEQQIRNIAAQNLAGNEARSKEGKKPKQDRDAKAYENLKQRINETVEAMRVENAVLAGLDPLVNDYGFALEKARVQQELLTAAKKAGVEVTPALEKEISDLAETYAFATVEAEKLAEGHDEIRERAEEALSRAKDMTRGVIDGFIEGSSAADILASSIKKIGNALIDDVLNNIFKINNASSGGFLSGILGLFGGGGAKVDPWAGLRGYDRGGYTGPGGKRQPAGVVHKGEVVWSQADVRRAGGVSVVEAMRRGLQGYVSGGAVAAAVVPQMPQLIRREASAAPANVTYAPVYNFSGTSEELAAFRRETARDRAEFSAKVVQSVRGARKRRML